MHIQLCERTGQIRHGFGMDKKAVHLECHASDVGRKHGAKHTGWKMWSNVFLLRHSDGVHAQSIVGTGCHECGRERMQYQRRITPSVAQIGNLGDGHVKENILNTRGLNERGSDEFAGNWTVMLTLYGQLAQHPRVFDQGV